MTRGMHSAIVLCLAVSAWLGGCGSGKSAARGAGGARTAGVTEPRSEARPDASPAAAVAEPGAAGNASAAKLNDMRRGLRPERKKAPHCHRQGE